MWRIGAKLAVSVALIWVLFHNADIEELSRLVLQTNYWTVGEVLALLASMTIPLTLRWSVILRTTGHPVGFRALFPIVWVGMFFNQTLPSAMGGDFVRMWFAHRFGLPRRAAIVSIVADRVYGLLALLLMVLAMIPSIFALPLDRAIKGSILLFLGVAFLGFAIATLLDRLAGRFEGYSFVRALAQFARDLRKILLTPNAIFSVLCYGFCMQVGSIVAVFILARGLGLAVSLSDCFWIIPLSNFLSALPVSMAGWGLREGAFVVAFGFVGVTTSSALALSVLYGLINLLIGLLGGIIWLFYGCGGPRRITISAPNGLNS